MPRILVFTAPGCAACHDYMPRLRRVSRPYDIDIYHYDVGERAGASLAQHYRIRATPTTIVFDSDERFRRVGSLPDDEIRSLLDRATRRR